MRTNITRRGDRGLDRTAAGGNTGSFAAADRTSASPPAPVTVHPNERVLAVLRLEQWVDDSAVEVDRVEIDLSALFENTPLDELPDEVPNHDGDNYYYEAVALGIAPDHDGPFSLSIEEEQLESYRERREEAGFTERDFPSSALRAEREDRVRQEIAALDEQIGDLQRRRKKLQGAIDGGAAHN